MRDWEESANAHRSGASGANCIRLLPKERFMKPLTLPAWVAALVFAPLLHILDGQERVDASMNARIRAEGLQRSQAIEVFNYLTSSIGPRLTTSPAFKRAVDWTQGRLRTWGLDKVRAEPFEFGPGWELTGLKLEMTSPRYMPLIG